MRELEELAATYTDPDFQKHLVEAFSLSALANHSYATGVFERLTEISDVIHLTTAGEEACSAIEAEGIIDLDASALKVAAFLSFYWDDLYVDVAATDTQAIAAAMDECVRDRSLRLPWLYGRLVDEVYLGRFGDYPSELDEDATETLVGELPQGVWQLGPFVTGPYGLLRSSDMRWLLPSSGGPAVGCTDPGCDALHRIRMTPPSSPIRAVERLIDGAAQEASGSPDPSAWPGFIRTLMLNKNGRDYHHDDLNPAVLAPFLPNAFAEGELRVLTSVVLRVAPETIRSALPGDGVLTLEQGPPETVTANLSAPEALQLLWLADDGTLVESIEAALDDGKLVVPPTETRGPVIVRASVYNGLYDVTCEVGRAGVRFVPQAWRPSVAMRLRKLVDEIYAEEGQKHLAWKLRGLSGADGEEKLDEYLATTPPLDVVEELLFDSEDRLEKAFASLRWGRFAVPETKDAEHALVDRMLWKLGVDIFDFPQVLPVFWDRLDGLQKVARELGHPYGEVEREALRGPGTNLFVALEDVLERAICFAAWALLEDHWSAGRRNRFVYTPQRARSFAASVLDGAEIGDGDVLQFSASSKNNLFALAAAFGIVARRCEELLEGESEALMRPASDLPHFLRDVGLERFPFVHVHPLLDLRAKSAEAILSALRQVHSSLERGAVLDVRNRIPHNREPFPSQEEIERAVISLDEVVSALEDLGVSATPFLFESEHGDRYGRSVMRLVDYAGRDFEIVEPTALRMAEMPPTSVPQLIFKAARIASTSEVLRFAYREDSEYLERWVDFPSRALPAAAEV